MKKIVRSCSGKSISSAGRPKTVTFERQKDRKRHCQSDKFRRVDLLEGA
jgi:hypothetical protein